MSVRAPLIVAAFFVATALTACGGDSGGDESASDAPTAAEPLSAAVDAFEQATASGDCEQLSSVVQSANLQGEPGSPTDADCKGLDQTVTQIVPDFKAEKTEQYGETAGIAEGTDSAGDSVVTILLVDEADQKFKEVAAFPGADSQIGTTPKSDTDFDGAIEPWVDALRTGDCKAAFRYSNLNNVFVTQANQDEGKFCDTFTEGTKTPDTLPSDLAADTSAAPVKLGETLDFAFYGLDANGRYRTVIVATEPLDAPPDLLKQHEDPAVQDYYAAEAVTGSG
jgi:hypothetical protein